jgi:hypothetical protein
VYGHDGLIGERYTPLGGGVGRRAIAGGGFVCAYAVGSEQLCGRAAHPDYTMLLSRMPVAGGQVFW